MSPVQMEGIVAMLRSIELIEGSLLAMAIVWAIFKSGGDKPIDWHRHVRLYLWGTGAIALPYALHCIRYENWEALVSYVVMAGATLGATALLYLLDRDKQARNRGGDLESVGLPDGSTD